MESPKEESDGPKEDENRFIDKSPPPRPPPPQIERSNSESAGIPSIDKLEKEYGDIARFKIFQLAGKR